MLEARPDALRLRTTEKARRQLARQIWILAEILEIPSAEGITLEIGPRPENKSHALIAGLLADSGADPLQQRRVPAARRRDLRREARRGPRIVYSQHIRRIFLLAQAVRAVAHEKRRNAVLFKILGLPEAFAGA